MKECKLIGTLPPLTDLSRVEKMFSHPYIYGVRLNTGIISPYTEKESVEIVSSFADKYKKKLWIDIKGRQLKVEQWGAPLYSSIKISHNFKVDLPAKVVLRGEKPLNLIRIKGKELFVSPLPKHAVGAGQSINIIGNNFEVEGYLTNKDINYLTVAKEFNVKNIMASFVESDEDIISIKLIHPDCKIVCKIESEKGIQNIHELNGFDLMAARDDLYLSLKQNPYYMNYCLRKIISENPNAICASRIFTSLDHSENIDFKDFEDLENMYSLGYKTFMLSDSISIYHLEEALNGWEIFINEK